MRESPGLKADWLAEIKNFYQEKKQTSRYISLSKILLQIGSKDTGR